MARRWLPLILAFGILFGGCVSIPPAAVTTARPDASPTALPTRSAVQPAATTLPDSIPPPSAAATASSERTAPATTPSARRPWQDDDPLPVTPDLHEGELANGLTYLVRQNALPRNRAEMRLVVNVGSVLEEDDQRGLAHFLEHMLFKGTQHFPGRTLLDFMESVGMRFGPDVNASTSFDETVYELRIPLDDPRVVDKALDVLVDWAGHASLDSTEVASERAVILEEHRQRELNANGRLRDQVLPALLGGSRYERRLPLGDMDVVQNATAEQLRHFYETWYRPDLMAVIVVGDFDAAQMEALVRQKFAVLPGTASPRPRPAYDVPDHAGTRYLVAADRENPTTSLELYVKQPVHESRTAGEYRDDLARALFYRMLNERYVEIARRADAPFTRASSGYDTLVRSAAVDIITARTEESSLLPALEALLTEVERVRRFGFTASELVRAQTDLLESYRLAYDDRNTTASSQLVEELIRHYLQGETVPGIDIEYDLARQYIPAITLDQVDREVANLGKEDNRTLVALAPRKEGLTLPSSDDLERVAHSIATVQIEPYREPATASALMTARPEPARVISQTTDVGLGLTDITLANGVRVLLKPTDFNQDEVVFSGVGPGGASLVEDRDYIAARMIGNIVAASGVAGFDRNQLDRLLTGKSVQVAPNIADLSQGLSGSASPQDLETAFQLIYLYATEPRIDADAVSTIKSAVRATLTNRQLSPQAAFEDAVTKLAYGDSIRRQGYPPLAEIENLDVERGLAVYKDRFANMGQFTFVFVGQFDVAAVTALARSYLGTLPTTGQRDVWRDRLPGIVGGVHELDVRKGQDQTSMALLIYSGAIEATPRNQVELELLRDILDMTLTRELRQTLGGTYAPSLSANVDTVPRPEYSLSINFAADPQRIDELVAATFAQVDSLRTTGPTQDDLDKAKAQEKRSLEESLRQNVYWLGVLKAYAFDSQHEDPHRVLVKDDVIERTTVRDIQAAAQRYLREDSYIRAVLYPDTSAPNDTPAQQARRMPVNFQLTSR